MRCGLLRLLNSALTGGIKLTDPMFSDPMISFVRDLDVDKADAELAATIITTAKNLHLDVVVEGVETEEQLQLLCRHGCTIFQGYYFHSQCDLLR